MYKIIFTLYFAWLVCLPSGVSATDKAAVTSAEKSTIVSVKPGNFVSAYAEFTSAVEQTMLTIPADKHFVLTDIIGKAFIEIKEGDVTKVKVQLGYSPDKNTMFPNPISLQTGIVFSPGSKVVVYPYPVGMGLDSSYGYVTLSGYYF